MSSSAVKQLVFAIFVAGLSIGLAGETYGQGSIPEVAQGSGTRAPGGLELPDLDLPAPDVEGAVDGSIPLADDFVPEMFAPDMDEAPAEVPFDADEGNPLPLLDDGYLMDYDATFGEDEAPIYSTNTWFNRGSWYTEMEAMVLTHDTHRISPVGFVVSTRDVLGNLTFGLTTNDLVIHQFETGSRLTLGRFLGRDAAGRDHQIDFSYMGGFNWEGNITVQSEIPDDFEVLNADDGIFANANDVGYTYRAELNSLEANYNIRTRPSRDQLAMQPDGKWVRHGMGSSMRSILAGFRALSYRDLVNITAANANQTSIGQYVTRTHNDMFGVQFGAAMREKHDALTWRMSGKVGVLLSFVDRLDAVATETNPAGAFFPDLDLSTDNFEDAEKLAFLAEVDLGGAYQVRPNLHFTAGYKFMYLSGIAQSPEQLSLSVSFPKLNVGGSTLFHGGSLGFETTW